MTTPEVFLTLSNMQNALLTALFEQMTYYSCLIKMICLFITCYNAINRKRDILKSTLT